MVNKNYTTMERGFFKEFFLDDPITKPAIYTLSLLFVLGTGLLVDRHISSKNPIVQKQSIGSEIPDVYIEKDGVRYYSHVDDRSVSNLVGKLEGRK